jgi:hypothetical protein
MAKIANRWVAVLFVVIALVPVGVATAVYQSMTPVSSETVAGLELAGSAARAQPYLCSSGQAAAGCATPEEAREALHADNVAFLPGYALTFLLFAWIAWVAGRRRAAVVAAVTAVAGAACDLVENAFLDSAVTGDESAWGPAAVAATAKFILLVPPLVIALVVAVQVIARPPHRIRARPE